MPLLVGGAVDVGGKGTDDFVDIVFGLLVALVNLLSSRKGGDPSELNCCNVTEDADGNLVLVADGKTIVMPKVDTTPQVKKVEKSGKEAAEA